MQGSVGYSGNGESDVSRGAIGLADDEDDDESEHAATGEPIFFFFFFFCP